MNATVTKIVLPVMALAVAVGLTVSFAPQADAATQCGISNMHHVKTKKKKRLEVRIYKKVNNNGSFWVCVKAKKKSGSSQDDKMSIRYGNPGYYSTKSTRGKTLSYSHLVPSGVCVQTKTWRTDASYSKLVC